ncbi:hypothetical protein ACVW0Y_001779 [Pseudomonas sp. TE3786]
MRTDVQIIAEVLAAFDLVERPEHFTNYLHCEECEEHDSLLRSHDRQSLKLDDVCNPGWNPISFCSPQGKAYYLPALVRFALENTEQAESYLMFQLMELLESDGPGSPLISYCSTEQRLSIAALLAHLVETRESCIERHDLTDQLLRAHGYWSA